MPMMPPDPVMLITDGEITVAATAVAGGMAAAIAALWKRASMLEDRAYEQSRQDLREMLTVVRDFTDAIEENTEVLRRVVGA